MDLSAIYEPVRKDLATVEDRLKSVSKVDLPALSKLLDYSLQGGGKRIRPIMALLSGKFYDYNRRNLLSLAMAVELMHHATLVHDDTIDSSPVRWGRPTINKLWGTEQAVLLGDYLFAKAGDYAAATGNLRVIRHFSQTLMVISSGELAQAYSAFNLEETRKNYLQRITRKTASLFTMATESGAVLSMAPQASIEILRDYGHNLGIAFQIVDDILDFSGTEEELGKPIGSDLAQGTFTLPAMVFLERYPEDDRVKRLFDGEDNKEEDIRLAVESIRSSPIIEECFGIASRYSERACDKLKFLPNNTVRQSLIDLADYIITRRK